MEFRGRRIYFGHELSMLSPDIQTQRRGVQWFAAASTALEGILKGTTRRMGGQVDLSDPDKAYAVSFTRKGRISRSQAVSRRSYLDMPLAKRRDRKGQVHQTPEFLASLAAWREIDGGHSPPCRRRPNVPPLELIIDHLPIDYLGGVPPALRAFCREAFVVFFASRVERLRLFLVPPAARGAALAFLPVDLPAFALRFASLRPGVSA